MGIFQSPSPLIAHFSCLKSRKWCEISVMLLCVLVCVTCHLKQMTSFHKIWYEFYIVWAFRIAIFIIVLQYFITRHMGLWDGSSDANFVCSALGKPKTSTFAKIQRKHMQTILTCSGNTQNIECRFFCFCCLLFILKY